MNLFDTLRIIHIAAGATAFLVAPIAMIVKKGGNAHRKWGLVFFWSMSVVAATAAVMAPMHKNLFLLMVSVFSFYLAFTDYRSLFRKKAYKTKKVAAIDWFFAILTISFSFGLFVFGISKMPNGMGVVAAVFGALGTGISYNSIKGFLKPSPDPQKWFFDHMLGMLTAYIAAVSAFSAVNLNYDWLPPVIQWLWPTIIGVPFMSRWMNSYRAKFSKGKKIKELVEVKIESE